MTNRDIKCISEQPLITSMVIRAREGAIHNITQPCTCITMTKGFDKRHGVFGTQDT